MKAHIKEHPAWFHRFDAVWTPTVLILDSEGKEHVRLEGYLPNDDFFAALMSSLGRIAFVQKKYSDAERWYGDVVARFANSHFAPEAMYWRAVATIKQRTITRCWAKSPRSFEPPTCPVCGPAKQFHGCIRNEAKETCHGFVVLDQPRESLTPMSFLTIDRTAPGSRTREKS